LTYLASTVKTIRNRTTSQTAASQFLSRLVCLCVPIYRILFKACLHKNTSTIIIKQHRKWQSKIISDSENYTDNKKPSLTIYYIT